MLRPFGGRGTEPRTALATNQARVLRIPPVP